MPSAVPADAPKKVRVRSRAAPVDNAEAAMRVLRRFRVVFNAVKTHFRQIEATVGIGGAQLWALGVVQQKPDMSVGDLARAMDIHQSTASNLVKSLVAKKLLATARLGEDRRAVSLRITAPGRVILRKAPGPLTGVLPEALASLDPRTLARLDADLQALMSALQADEEAGGIPLAQL